MKLEWYVRANHALERSPLKQSHLSKQFLYVDAPDSARADDGTFRRFLNVAALSTGPVLPSPWREWCEQHIPGWRMKNDLMSPEATFRRLLALPEWEFILVCHEGLLSDPHAGCTYKGQYYSEHEIHCAYLARNPSADPLI